MKEDLVHYAQEAFGVDDDYHRRCHAIASEEKVNTSVVPNTVSPSLLSETFDRTGIDRVRVRAERRNARLGRRSLTWVFGPFLLLIDAIEQQLATPALRIAALDALITN